MTDKPEVERLREALKPFAACADELDGSADVPRAPDGEWAKFRLLTDDYRRARAALASPAPRMVGYAGGWIVANGSGTQWRTWGISGPEWTSDREAATRYHRREDAEAVHGCDEDAWTIEAYAPSHPTTDDRDAIRRACRSFGAALSVQGWGDAPIGEVGDSDIEAAMEAAIRAFASPDTESRNG